jgi:predicted nucleotidyltransferase
MNLSVKDHKTLENSIQKIDKDPLFIGMILFGSALHSDQYHDIDIALISTNPPISDQEKLKIILSFPEKFDVRFLEDFPLNIAKDVIRGNLILNKDYNEIFDRFISIFQNWELFRPSFELYLEVSKSGV